MTTDPPPPRRKWHLQRWLLLLAAGFLAYGGWTQYAFRAALKEARALGWAVYYTDPYEVIRADWKAAFRKATWLDGVTHVDGTSVDRWKERFWYELEENELDNSYFDGIGITQAA